MSTEMATLVMRYRTEGAARTERETKGVASAADDASKSADDMGKSFDRASDAKARYRKAAAMGAAAALAAGAAVAKIARDMMVAGVAIQDNAVRLGITNAAYQELQFVAEQANVSIDTLSGSMYRASRRIANAATGSGPAVRAVRDLGIEAAAFAEIPLDEQLTILVDKINSVENAALGNQYAFEILGDEAKQLIPLIRQGSEGIEELRATMRSTGAIMSDELIAASNALGSQLDLMRKHGEAVKIQLANQLIPALLNTSIAMLELETSGESAGTEISGLEKAGRALGVGLNIAVRAVMVLAAAGRSLADILSAQIQLMIEMGNLLVGGFRQAVTQAATAWEALLDRRPLDALKAVSVDAVQSIGAEMAKSAQSARGIISGMTSDIVEDWQQTIDRIATMADALNRDLPGPPDRPDQTGDTGPTEQAKIALAELRAELEAMAAALDGPVAQAQLAYEADLERMTAILDEAGAGAELYAEVQGLLSARLQAVKDEAASAGKEVQRQFRAQATGLQMEIAALQGGERAWADYARQMEIAQIVAQAGTEITDEQRAEIAALAEQLVDLRDGWDQDAEIKQLGDEIDSMIGSILPAVAALDEFQYAMERIAEAARSGAISEQEAAFAKTTVAADAFFGALASGMDQSSESYKELMVIQQAVNTLLGIQAILQTAATAPWPVNFVAMAQMAAMVASLIGSVGSLGGGGGNLAASRQETQGTGTVLGDPFAKSESIANALDITADATSALVGINRGMLYALQAMQQGIAGAATILARGGLNFDLSSLSLGSSDWGMTSTRVADMGLSMGGGTISQMADSASAQTYATTRRSNIFSTSYRTAYEEAGEDLNNQLALVFRSMIDTVTEAGTSLGISQAEIEDRVRSFRVAAFEISLMDLSAEEQQQEIEAVFSAIFDDLAAHVIPFIGQFQQIGEGMAETLIRVATSVQVTEEAIGRLGLQISDGLGPEKMAQVSVGLIEAAGGIEEFISQMENFVAKFAPEAHQFEIAQSDITRGLEQMGLALPETRDGFWLLIQSIDATTEAGQRQIATLLGLADAADTYYSALESVQSEREGLERKLLQLQGDTAALRALELETLDESNQALQLRIWALEDEIELAGMVADVGREIERLTMAPLVAEVRQLRREHAEQIKAYDALGASAAEYTQLQHLHQLQLEAMAGRMRDAIAANLELLFGSGGVIEQSFGEQFTAPIAQAADAARDSLIRALEGVDEWLRRSSIDDPSLTRPQRFEALQDEFYRLIDTALTGTGQAQADAVAMLPKMADELAELGGQMLGTATPEFQALWAGIVDAMEQVSGIDVPPAQQPPTAAQVGRIESTLEAVEISAIKQAELAAHTLEMLGSLAKITGQSPIELLAEMGYPLRDLIEMLIGDISDLNADTMYQLMAVARTLGVDLGALGDALDLTLGTIYDKESKLSRALESTVAGLPDGIDAELGPLLDDIWNATSEADANEAIGHVKDAINQLSPDLAEQFKAFFPDVTGIDPLDVQVGLLEQIRNYQREAAEALTLMSIHLAGLGGLEPVIEPPPGGPPGYASGGWVNGDSIIRAGEAGRELVLPNPVSEFFAREGIPVNNSMSSNRIERLLERIVERQVAAEMQREQIGREQVSATHGVSHSLESAERANRSTREVTQ